jgi:hypothetical protein
MTGTIDRQNHRNGIAATIATTMDRGTTNVGQDYHRHRHHMTTSVDQSYRHHLLHMMAKMDQICHRHHHLMHGEPSLQ